ncbi:MAG: protein kinase domain-containing protein [Myxococcota bacterium]
MSEANLETLGGRYRLDRQRTEFPFGALWEADDVQGGRVLLLLSPPGVEGAGGASVTAVETSSAVKSSNVVPWSDGGATDDGRFWLVAPLLGGLSFSELVERSDGLSPDEAAPIVQQVARAVAAGEEAGVHHLALCGELVRLVELDGGRYAAKVYGFGLAGLLPGYKPLRKKDPFLGVPDYMAPELCQGKPAGAPADVYAMGILLYEAIRGRPPFAARSARASASTTLKRQIFEKPLALHMRYGGLDYIKPYEAITLRALSKQISQRQRSAGDLQEELTGLMEEPMGLEPVSEDAVPGAAAAGKGAQRTQVLEGFADQARAVQAKLDADQRVEEARRRLSEAEEEAATAEEAGPEEAGPEEEESAAPKTIVTAGLSPEVKARARGREVEEEDARTVVDQRAVVPPEEAEEAAAGMDEEAAPSGEAGGRPRGEEGRTLMDVQGVDAGAEGVHEDWFVEHPEDLAHEGPEADYFSPERRRRPYLLVAGLVLIAVIVGLVWYFTGRGGTEEAPGGEAAEQQTAPRERPTTAAEAEHAKREAQREARDEAAEESRKAEEARRAREALQEQVLAGDEPEVGGEEAAAEGEGADEEEEAAAEGEGADEEEAPAEEEVAAEEEEAAAEEEEAPAEEEAAAEKTQAPAEEAEGAAQKAAAEKAAAEKAAAEKEAEARRRRAARRRAAAEKEAADKEAADKEAADKEAADKEAADKEAADKEAGEEELSQKEREAQSKAEMRKGLQALKSEEYETAVQHFTRAKRLNPDNALAAKFLEVAKEKRDQ